MERHSRDAQAPRLRDRLYRHSQPHTYPRPPSYLPFYQLPTAGTHGLPAATDDSPGGDLLHNRFRLDGAGGGRGEDAQEEASVLDPQKLQELISAQRASSERHWKRWLRGGVIEMIFFSPAKRQNNLTVC